MGLNDKVSAERVHIGFFGLRNAGKSSVVNAVTGQSLSLVSETKGTTTDPVQKAMELLPIGPVVIIDTPGIDDVGTLGEMRVKRALQVLDKTDIAILVVDADKGLQQADQELLTLFEGKKIPHITVYNKSDLLATAPSLPEKQPEKNDAKTIDQDAKNPAAKQSAAASESRNVQMTAGQAPEEEPTVSQDLLDFFDAMDEKNYDRMLECLTKLSAHATRKELDDICLVLDINPPAGCDDSLSQIMFIKRHLAMIRKFDGERLR